MKDEALAFQQQVGETDHGVYSIAAAYSASLGIKSHLVNFDADEMQRHLEQCFENIKLTPSPHRNLLINVELEKHVFSDDCGLLESYDSDE